MRQAFRVGQRVSVRSLRSLNRNFYYMHDGCLGGLRGEIVRYSAYLPKYGCYVVEINVYSGPSWNPKITRIKFLETEIEDYDIGIKFSNRLHTSMSKYIEPPVVIENNQDKEALDQGNKQTKIILLTNKSNFLKVNQNG